MAETQKIKQRRKAIALLSGGLDSTLAAKIIMDQGVDVIGLHLLSSFGCKTQVQKSADNIGIPVIFKDKGAAYLDLIENPRFGYGANMNPCIDCRIYMFQLADVVRHEENADFIVTGEVLGQRPMSQRRESISRIDKESSPLEGRILRPLSAHHFPPTLPEIEGWVNRDELYEIAGRGRTEQLKLAASFGITEFSAPGGGCLLTESAFSNKLRDFFKNPQHKSEEERLSQSALLRYGRHFRLSPKTKLVIGRDENENKELEKLWKAAGGTLVNPDNFDGPSAVVIGEFTDEVRIMTGEIISRYGKSAGLPEKNMRYFSGEKEGSYSVQNSFTDSQLEGMRL